MLKKDELAAANQGQGCLGKSAPDEPVFILVARDVYAADVVRHWADLVELRARSSAALTAALKEKIAGARRTAILMDTWPHKKTPD